MYYIDTHTHTSVDMIDVFVYVASHITVALQVTSKARICIYTRGVTVYISIYICVGCQYMHIEYFNRVQVRL